MSIRLKVILPYFLLTIVVASIGLYVITNLIATRQEERLKNQLLDAGRVVSREFNRQERNRLTQARQIAYTEGLLQALRAGDRPALERVVRPLAESARLQEVYVIDLQGREQLHLLRNADGTLERIEGEVGLGKAAWLAPLLVASGEVSDRIWGRNPLDGRYYHYSALTVVEGRRVAGVVVIGAALETILPELKNFAIADITLYDGEGRIIASTLPLQESDPQLQDAFALAPRTLREIHESSDLVLGENFTLAGRSYSIARDVLQVGQRNLGVFGVILPLDFVISLAQESRNGYLFLFGAIALGVVAVGYLVSRPLIVSLQRLLQASLAVAGGDLDQRTHIRTNDEIGELARTFDEMTARLQARTEELQKTYAILEQMDRAKASFIDCIGISVGNSVSGPWYQVLYWCDATVDFNTNISAYPENDNEYIPGTALYHPSWPPPCNGVTIDIDPFAPPGTYRYVRLYAPPGGDNDGADVDAIGLYP